MKTKELLIIIPAYNEGKNIQRVLEHLEQLEEMNFSDVADILVINDASTDTTNWIVKQMQYPMISQLYNMGYGCALQTGYKYAVRRGYKYLIQMDGDGQHDVCNIPVIYQKLRETDQGGATRISYWGRDSERTALISRYPCPKGWCMPCSGA